MKAKLSIFVWSLIFVDQLPWYVISTRWSWITWFSNLARQKCARHVKSSCVYMLIGRYTVYLSFSRPKFQLPINHQMSLYLKSSVTRRLWKECVGKNCEDCKMQDSCTFPWSALYRLYLIYTCNFFQRIPFIIIVKHCF